MNGILLESNQRLVIKTDDGRTVPVSRDDAPDLFDAFNAWTQAQAHSAREHYAWQEVTDAADEYLQGDTAFADTFTDTVNREPLPHPFDPSKGRLCASCNEVESHPLHIAVSTAAVFAAIADELTRRGFKAESQQTGGNVYCILVESATGALYLFGTGAETWCADAYAWSTDVSVNREAYGNGDFSGELVTTLPSDVTNPALVADAIADAIAKTEDPPTPQNVYELLVAHGIRPTREDYREYPLDSVCGEAVADIVTKAQALITVTDPAVHASIRASVEHAAGIVCFG